MIGNILLARTGISVEPIVNAVVCVIIIALIITFLIWLLNYFGTARKEQKFIRMELGKIGEEVHLISQQLTKEKDQEASAESE